MNWPLTIITLVGQLARLAPPLRAMCKAYREGRDDDTLAALDAAKVELERALRLRKGGAA
jgi:hypothetical protein